MSFPNHHHLQRFQSRQHILLSLLIFSLVRPCVCTGVCPVVTKSFSQHPGSPTGDKCTFMDGRATDCSIRCATLPLCKLVYTAHCILDTSRCTCAHCEKLIDVANSDGSQAFYLHTQEIAANTRIVPLSGGLVVGEPLLMKIALDGIRVTLNFYDSQFNNAFMTDIRFDEGSVVSNTYINNRWGSQENRYTPHFNFQRGGELSVLCVVTTTAYKLYFDGVLFKQFHHAIDPHFVIEFRLTSSYDQAKVLSFQR